MAESAECQFKKWLTMEDGTPAKAPCCGIAPFECQFTKDTSLCPLKAQREGSDVGKGEQ